MKFTFTTKDTYLQQRAEWKAEYQALAQRIRDLKFCRKPAHIGSEPWERLKKEYGPNFSTGWAQGVAAILRRKAAQMLLDLAAAKVEAQRQYLAAKAKQMAA